MTSIAVYAAEEVHDLLDYQGCINAVREAMKRFSGDATSQPLRNIIQLAPTKLFAIMPGMLTNPDGFGAKVVSAFPHPSRQGRSAHRGVVVLFDRESGEVSCIADAGAVTEIRTAAASAVATDALARPDACRLSIFGTGAQAETHVRAIALVRKLKEVNVWGRSLDRSTQFAEKMSREMNLPIRSVADAREAASQADVICTLTSSPTPILLGDWVCPGTHVNAVGSSFAGPVEVDHTLVIASRYIVDSRRSALAAAAEFILAKQAGLIGDDHIVAEIGEVLLGKLPGRTSTQQIMMYKSLGHIVQDLAATTYLHARAGTGKHL